MTKTIAAPMSSATLVKPQICYRVAMPEPASHLFEVTLTVTDWQAERLDVKLPVWTPGSYMVREYAKHLQDFGATDAQGNALAWTKCSKNHWQIETPMVTAITLTYRVYAHDLTVRTNHLDRSHGYFNPGALLMYLPGWEQMSVEVAIAPPHPHWQVTTALPPVDGHPHTFIAADYDTLVDSPVEIGTHAIHEFEVLGKPHQWAIWGTGNFEIDRIITDTQKIVEVEAEIFGSLPYDRYLFLLHLSASGYGGLEHKESTSLLFSRFNFHKADQYHRFICLVAHEFFHLWNVKRLRPQALETFDYDQENYTDCLWFCEGVTSFYDLIIPVWAGIYDAKTYLKLVSDSINRLQGVPGRQVQSLSESSFDTWIKLYRPDANSNNAQVSYYLKGELVALLLDLLIRRVSNGTRSLNTVMQRMWHQFGQHEIGYTQAQLRAVIEAVAEQDLSQFWANYIDGTTELPYNDYLQPFGLTFASTTDEAAPPYLGIELPKNPESTKIKSVAIYSPAQRAGLCAGDELLAIDGFRVTARQLNDRLTAYPPGTQVQVTVFHDQELVTYPVTLAPAPLQAGKIQPMPSPTRAQQALCQTWLGGEWAQLL